MAYSDLARIRPSGRNIPRVRQLDASVRSRPAIELACNSTHNGFGMIVNGVLFTTSGIATSWNNATTGRGATGTTTLYGLEWMSPVLVPGRVVKAGGFNNSFAYALTNDGRLYTWGSNINGQCGIGTTTAVITPTLAVSDVVEVYTTDSNVDYSVDQNRLFIKKTDGRVYVAGYNGGAAGMCGINNGSATNVTTFTEIKDSSGNQILNVSKVFNMGSSYGCVFLLTTDGKIYAAGTNTYGQLGDATTTHRPGFVDVTSYWSGGYSSVDNIDVWGGYGSYNTAENARSCTVMHITRGSQGYVMAAGNNSWGTIGGGKTVGDTTYSTPCPVDDTWSNVVELKAGGGNACSCICRLANGTVYAWGYNGLGQLGNGGTNTTSVPQLINNLANATAFFGPGSAHVYPYQSNLWAIKEGRLYVSGYNTHGECGVGDKVNKTTFTEVLLPYGETPVQLARFSSGAQVQAYVVLTQRGNLYAWGNNAYRAILDSSTAGDVVAPVLIQVPYIYTEASSAYYYE